MSGFSANELSKLLKGRYIDGHIPEINVDDFEFQASKLVDYEQKNYCFISISRERWNEVHKIVSKWTSGNEEILKHYKKCKLIITEKPVEQLVGKVPQFIVENSYQSMKILAKSAREKMRNPVIGITGSVGKSSTRLMFEHLLEDNHSIVATRGNHNTQTGVPLYAAKLCKNPDIGILEISLNALNNRGNQSLTVKPDIAIVTSIGEAHLSTLHTTENIAKFKARIFAGLNDDGLAIINHDIEKPEFDILYQAAKVKTGRVKTYSMENNQADLYLKEISAAKYTTAVTFTYKERDYQFKMKMPSEGIIQNALAVFLCLGEMGYDLTGFLSKIYHFKSLPKIMDLNTYRTKDDRVIDIIDDSHNAAIPSMVNAIRTFKTKQKYYRGNSILVLGQVADLGAKSEELHQTLIPEILASGADYVFGHGPYMRNIIKQLPNEMIGGWFDNARDLSRHIPLYCNDDSLVLLKGSISGSDFYLTSRYLVNQLSNAIKELKGYSPNEIADAIQPVYSLSLYDAKNKNILSQSGSKFSRTIEGLSHIILLLLLLKKNIHPEQISPLNKWETNTGDSINQKPFKKGELFTYAELIDELILTQHPSATYQLAKDHFGSSTKALEEIIEIANKLKISPSATLNLTGRYRVKEQQSYGIDDLYAVGQELYPYRERFPIVCTADGEQIRGIIFGKVRLSFIGFVNDQIICVLGAKSKEALYAILNKTIIEQKNSKDLIR